MIGGRGVMAVLGGLAALLLAIAVVSGCQGANRLPGHGEGIGEAEEAARLFVEAYGSFRWLPSPQPPAPSPPAAPGLSHRSG